MRKSQSIVLIMICVLSLGGMAQAAGLLDDAFVKTEAAPWGKKAKDAIRALGLTPVLEKPEALVARGALGGREVTVNCLFNKAGGLYNLAWYALIPTTDLDAARKFDADLEAALKAKYGKPSRVFNDGDPDDLKKMEKDADKIAALKEKLDSAKKEKKKAALSPEEQKLLKDNPSILISMPSIFYSRLNFWNGGNFWVYTNLLCSTDGTCYMHLQFVSKRQTSKESYSPTPEKPFSYSPLDRDQDLVTRVNRELSAKK